MNLDNLDFDSKAFISTIVDGYVKGKEYMENSTNPDIDNPGMMIQDVLTSCSKESIYNVTFHKLTGSAIEIYYIFSKSLIHVEKDEDVYDEEEKLIKKFRSEVIYKISLLRLLQEDGYIFLVDDKNWNCFDTGNITEKDKQRWESSNQKYYREELKSTVLFEFLSQFNGSFIIPSPQLIDFRKNNFKTTEALRFEEQMNIAKRSLIIAKRSNIIAIAIGIISLLASCIITKCCSTKIDKTQISQIVETINNNG